MFINFNFFLFFFLAALCINESLIAVGGPGTEQVSAQEATSKGIVRIAWEHDPRNGGSGVLFKEGNGRFGLSAKHVFKDFDSKKNPYCVHLGNQKRTIVKVYSPKNSQADLALFVLSSPFEGGEFAELPTSSLSVQLIDEGYLYGYGSTNAVNHPGTLENSFGICRKGKIHFTPFKKLPTDYILLTAFPKMCLANHQIATEMSEYFYSFSVIQAGKKDIYKNYPPIFEKLVESRQIPITEKINLNTSCYVLKGDSGGPLISSSKQILGIQCIGSPIYSHKVDILRLDTPHHEEYNKSHTCNLSGFPDASIGFIKRQEDKELYFNLKSPLPQASEFKDAATMFQRQLEDYFLNNDPTFFHTIVNEEAQNPSYTPITQWLKESHVLYFDNYFVPIARHRDWIERAMQVALR